MGSISNCVAGHTLVQRERRMEEGRGGSSSGLRILSQVDGEPGVDQPLDAILGGTCFSKISFLEVEIELP